GRPHGEEVGVTARNRAWGARYWPACQPNRHAGRNPNQAAERGGRKIGQRVHVLNVSNQSEIDAAFTAMKVDALLSGVDPIFSAYRSQLIALAARHKIPAIYTTREYCEIGGLMSYGASLPNSWS